MLNNKLVLLFQECTQIYKMLTQISLKEIENYYLMHSKNGLKQTKYYQALW
jgi:hypothetical protein